MLLAASAPANPPYCSTAQSRRAVTLNMARHSRSCSASLYGPWSQNMSVRPARQAPARLAHVTFQVSTQSTCNAPMLEQTL